MDETQEKSVIESDNKEKIANAIDQLDLLHSPFISHADYGDHTGHWGQGMTSSWYEGGWKTHHRRCRGLVRMWR
jgi:hypothetical protein